jgi:hypothetical protein
MSTLFRSFATCLKACLAATLLAAFHLTPAFAQAQSYSANEIANAPECSTYPTAQSQQLCWCLSGFTTGSVWGSGPYTADSNICTAALHAGVITQRGGPVVALREPGQNSYSGTHNNGVSTADWGAYGDSYRLVGAQQTVIRNVQTCSVMPDGLSAYSCNCAGGNNPSASVWGSGPYTADSNLCNAARHAGAIGQNGGAISVFRLTGLDSYRGSSANGISTSTWGSYNSSIVINGN